MENEFIDAVTCIPVLNNENTCFVFFLIAKYIDSCTPKTGTRPKAPNKGRIPDVVSFAGRLPEGGRETFQLSPTSLRITPGQQQKVIVVVVLVKASTLLVRNRTIQSKNFRQTLPSTGGRY